MKSVKAIIKARDRLLKDILDEAGDLRGRLMAVCANCIPDKMDFIEGMILVSLLSQMKLVDLRDENLHTIDLTTTDTSNPDYYYYHSNGGGDDDDDDDNDSSKATADWSYEMDDNGRITKLGLLFDDDDKNGPFDLPPGIGRLDRLTDITVWNCRSLPAKSLSYLPRLQTLRLYRCSDLFNKFPLEMELSFLKKLCIDSCRLHPSSKFISWMISQLPILESLELNHMLLEETNRILEVLCCTPDGGVGFEDSLNSLVMSCCRLGDEQFKYLMLNMLVKYPNISSLNLMGNNIHSIQSIVDRIKSNGVKTIDDDDDDDGNSENGNGNENRNGESFSSGMSTNSAVTVSKSIRHLHIAGNPIMKNMKDDVNETIAILAFLKTFTTLYNLGSISINNIAEITDDTKSTNEWTRMTSSFINNL